MGNYTGFKDDVNPSISNVFATAVFRFGHVTIHPEFRRLDENFDDHPQFPTILLHEAFFASWRIIREGGADPIVRGTRVCACGGSISEVLVSVSPNCSREAHKSLSQGGITIKNTVG